MNIVSATKRYVGDDRFRVRLFETIAQDTRRVLLELDGKDVPASAIWSDDEFRRRVGVYDDALSDLCQAEALMGRWGGRVPAKCWRTPSRERATVLNLAATVAG
jgi:hypothetical protein